MHKSEIDRTLNRIKALVFAAGDMDQAEAAAKALADERTNGHLERALETAMVVCYWRPFSPNNAVRLIPEDHPPTIKDEASRTHKILKALRNKVYAHTDKNVLVQGVLIEPRTLEPSEEVLGPLTEHERSLLPMFMEGWRPIEPEWLPPIQPWLEITKPGSGRDRVSSGRSFAPTPPDVWAAVRSP